jgi:hypothetical protein
MTKKPLEKWKSLLKQTEIRSLSTLEVIQYNSQTKLCTLTLEQLNEFERKSEIILPEGYKEYYQIFGSGMFGKNQFRITSLRIEDIEGQLSEGLHSLELSKEAYEYPQGVVDIFENSYLFGCGSAYTSFVFDLRTFDKSDNSYDIYGLGDNINYVYFLGRDFFDFIKDICLGKRANKEFPGLLVGAPRVHPEQPVRDRVAFFSGT